MDFPSVSIIIPIKENNENLKECIKNCLNLDYPFFEILIMSDNYFDSYSDSRIRIIPTGNVSPPIKRDLASAEAKGEILAFLDDDTYPSINWLKQAVINFRDPSLACVCGPAVTPAGEPFLQLVSARIYESVIVSGPVRFRYVPGKRRYIDDFPSCNFLIKNKDFITLGGFGIKFWPGEDTILCLAVISMLKKKILYDPNVIVFHHRRPVFKKHLNQVANYALHRGYFVRRFGKNSFKIAYFVPSAIVILLSISLILGAYLNYIFFYFLFAYLFIVLLFSFNKDLRLFIYLFLGIVMTHFVYGINFIKGFFSSRLKEE